MKLSTTFHSKKYKRQAKLKRQINNLGPPILKIWNWSLKFGVGILVLKFEVGSIDFGPIPMGLQ